MPRGRRSQPRRGSPVSTPHVDLNTLTVYELRARCHDAGLPETGRKAALVARLSNANQPPRGTVNQETPPGQHQGAESDPPLATDGALERAIERILDRRLQAYGQTQTLKPALAFVTGPILPALCSERDDSSATVDVEWERTIVFHNTPARPEWMATS